MTESAEIELRLPAPRFTPALPGVIFWYGFLAWAAYDIGPAFGLGIALFAVIGLYLVYLALYSLYGQEVLAVTEDALISRRILFGRTTRVRTYRREEMGTIGVSAPGVLESMFRGSSFTIGYDGGTVSFPYRGRTARVAEGLCANPARSAEVAAWLQQAIPEVSASSG